MIRKILGQVHPKRIDASIGELMVAYDQSSISPIGTVAQMTGPIVFARSSCTPRMVFNEA